MTAISTLFVVSLLFSSIAAHSFLTNIMVNGQYQDACVQPHGNLIDYPMSDITNPSGLQSNLMTCGRTSGRAQSKCVVPAGSTVGFQWHYWQAKDQLKETFIIDPSHKGPCLVYMARSDTGTGPVWFKIFEDGYNGQSFCVDRLRANKGLFNAVIPTDLAPGNYLVRVELIALHEGHLVGGAQPYVHCAELTITGSGTSIPSSNLVSFPGAYKANDAGLSFNIYNGFKTYPIPGPALYKSSAVVVSTGAAVPSSTSTTTGAAVPSSTSTTTGRASTSTTTGRASTSTTTGRASTSTTTGAAVPSSTSTTTGTIVTPAPVCDLGKQQCLSSETYRICMKSGNTVYWSPEQSCRTGDTCHQTDEYIFCY